MRKLFFLAMLMVLSIAFAAIAVAHPGHAGPLEGVFLKQGHFIRAIYQPVPTGPPSKSMLSEAVGLHGLAIATSAWVIAYAHDQPAFVFHATLNPGHQYPMTCLRSLFTTTKKESGSGLHEVTLVRMVYVSEDPTEYRSPIGASIYLPNIRDADANIILC